MSSISIAAIRRVAASDARRAGRGHKPARFAPAATGAVAAKPARTDLVVWTPDAAAADPPDTGATGPVSRRLDRLRNALLYRLLSIRPRRQRPTIDLRV